MKFLLTAMLLIIGHFSFSQPFTHEAHKVEYNEGGKVFYEKVYNVYNREAADIIQYAKKFAASQGYLIESEDEVNHLITIRPSWKVDDINKGNPLYGVTIIPTIQISAKTSRTRVYISDIMFEGTTVCGQQGTIERLFSCEDIKKNQKNAIAVFLNEGKPYQFLVDYKKHLEKSVKGNSW